MCIVWLWVIWYHGKVTAVVVVVRFCVAAAVAAADVDAAAAASAAAPRTRGPSRARRCQDALCWRARRARMHLIPRPNSFLLHLPALCLNSIHICIDVHA